MKKINKVIISLLVLISILGFIIYDSYNTKPSNKSQVSNGKIVLKGLLIANIDVVHNNILEKYNFELDKNTKNELAKKYYFLSDVIEQCGLKNEFYNCLAEIKQNIISINNCNTKACFENVKLVKDENTSLLSDILFNIYLSKDKDSSISYYKNYYFLLGKAFSDCDKDKYTDMLFCLAENNEFNG